MQRANWKRNSSQKIKWIEARSQWFLCISELNWRADWRHWLMALIEGEHSHYCCCIVLSGLDSPSHSALQCCQGPGLSGSPLQSAAQWQLIQVSDKPRLSPAAHHYHRCDYHQLEFCAFCLLSAWEIVQMPLSGRQAQPSSPPHSPTSALDAAQPLFGQHCFI